MNIRMVESISEAMSSMERLAESERRFKVTLPDDYRAFLLTTNGGRPQVRNFAFGENGRRTESAIGWFFGDCDDEDYGLDSNFEMYGDRIPPSFLPIAADSFGNL